MRIDREPVEKNIDGENYTFYILSPRISFPVLIALAQIIAPSLAAFLNDAKNSSALEGKDVEEMSNEETLNALMDTAVDLEKIVSLLLKKINAKEAQDVIDALLSQAVHKGEGHVIKAYDKLFTGNLLHLFKVVYAAIGVQFSDFLAGKSVIKGLKSMADSTLV